MPVNFSEPRARGFFFRIFEEGATSSGEPNQAIKRGVQLEFDNYIIIFIFLE